MQTRRCQFSLFVARIPLVACGHSPGRLPPLLPMLCETSSVLVLDRRPKAYRRFAPRNVRAMVDRETCAHRLTVQPVVIALERDVDVRCDRHLDLLVSR